MECHEALEMINASIDRQIGSAEATALEAHLSICVECRSTCEALRAQDANLLRSFGPHREAAYLVADRVLDTWREELGETTIASATEASSPTPGVGNRWGWHMLSAAAGFLVAAFLFQPWQENTTIVQVPIDQFPIDQIPIGDPVEIQPMRKDVASLVVTTGDVEVREQPDAAWKAYTSPADFRCASGASVRTSPNIRCELKTESGCVVRLNSDTEITLPSADSVEVQRGEIWCSSPENVSLSVSTSKAVAQPPHVSTTLLPTLTCPSNSRMMTTVDRDGEVRVTAADGEIEVQTPTCHNRLKRGESATISGDQIVKNSQSTDPILAASWMHSLLIQKGHADEELTSRIDELLAQLGHSKVTLLYEQEIRSLGQRAVLPLLRYVQSPMSRDEGPRRLMALRILSDIAPSWTVADLIQLLSDEDPETRYYAARTLERLTGLDQGRAPAAWREDITNCGDTIELWRQWWTKSRPQYPPSIVASKFD